MRAPRDYAAEYAARKARGVAKGLSVAQATGHAKRVGQRSMTDLGATVRQARARAGEVGTRRRPTSDVSTSAGRIRRTGDQSVVRDIVRQAAARGDNVVIRGKFQRPDGTWRTATLGATGSTDRTLGLAQRHHDAARAGGRTASTGARPGALVRGGRGQVEIRTGGDRGMDATELDDFLDLYDSVWDALADLFDEAEY